MEIRFTYRHVDSSAALTEYTQTQLQPVSASILSSQRWQVCYSMGRYDYHVEINVHGPWGHYKAEGKAQDFYVAVDMAIDKMHRQIQKRKEQLQTHKRPELSKRGQLEQVNEQLEFEPWIHRKSA
jgi:ribosomal subunit interface protein